MRVGQCVTAVKRWRCQYWSAYVAAVSGRRGVSCARLALKVAVQSGGDLVDVILLYIRIPYYFVVVST
jgi:hypothetical protein